MQPPYYAARLRRVNEIGSRLASDIERWSLDKPWRLVGRIAEDRLSYRLILEETRRPPLEDWALQFSEGVHQLRSSLDNYLSHLARSAGVTDPAALKQIQFPIVDKEKNWKSNRDRIRLLSETTQTAIEQIQPFQRTLHGEDLKEDALALLRDFSNKDKHQAYIVSKLNPTSIAVGATVEFETEEGARASVPPDTTFYETRFQTGDVLLIHRTKGRIAKIQGNYNLSLSIMVEWPDGRSARLTKTLSDLLRYTAIVLDHVAAAAEPPTPDISSE